MKVKAIIVGLVALIGFFGISMTLNNKMEVPEAVKTAFSKKYPAAKKVEWELERVGEYEAEFKLNDQEMSANFSEDGIWVGSETEIKIVDLPQIIQEAVGATFPNTKIEEAELAEKPNNILVYEVELEDEKQEIEFKAIFSADGTFIKKEIEEEENEEEDHNK